MKPTRRFFVIGLPAAIAVAAERSVWAGPRVGPAKSTSTTPIRPSPSRPRAVQVDAATLEQARTHVIAPAHVRGVTMDRGVSPSRARITRTGRSKDRVLQPRLDVEKFGQKIHAKLGSTVNGYAWQLRQHGNVIHNGIWAWSRNPDDGGQGWGLDTRMHVASVSKLLTAMAMAHKLKAANRAYTDLIWDYLPSYWALGSKIKDIQFRHLLNHTTGFRVNGSDSDYVLMRTKVAAGVAGTFGMYGYENMNFGLCRILIPVMHGWIDKNDTHGDVSDTIWDIRTTTRFREYCQTHVFSPSGVSNVGFKPQTGGALAYGYPVKGAGWNSGDLTTVSGGAGFRMSVTEVLDVMGTFRRSGKILSPADAQSFLDMALGIDQIIETPAGNLYNKNGAWGTDDGRLEQSVAYFMPHDMEMVMFVNSPIAKPGDGASLRKTVADAYIASLG